ncbi:phage minor head protein [Streptomyces sp. NPDC050095]|uniref:phage minor head protein n=1 Tax=unclassified Streptomyces TaxID=2593676 RepID=UPI0034266C64
MTLTVLISRAMEAFRTRLTAWLTTAREVVARLGVNGWPSDWATAVPPTLAPFLIEAYMNGAGGLAAAHPRAVQYAQQAVERIGGGHWETNTFRKLTGLPPDQRGALFDMAAHEAWANALVQTELRSAMNAGTLTAALLNAAESGVPMLKTWRIHMPLDGRTRDAHMQANGQTVPVDQPFTVGGERLMFPGDPTSASPAQTWHCRCSLRLTPAPLTASGGTMPVTTAQAGPEAGPDDIRFTGPLAPIEQDSGDQRRLGATERLDTRELPLPLLFQPSLAERHQGAVQGLAILRHAWVEGGVLHGSGTFDGRDPDAAKVADKIARGYLGWVSVDLDKALMELDDSNPEAPVEVVRSWRLTGATLVGQPAFDKHAKIRILDDDEELPLGPAMQDPTAPEQQQPAPGLLDGIDPGTSDENAPTVDTDADEIPPSDLDPTAEPLDEPAADAPTGKPTSPRPEPKTSEPDGEDDEKKRPFALDADTRQRASLVASSIPVAPPAAWFDNPGFDKPTAMHVTPEGQVFGHLAEWNSPHLSFPGRKVFAPKSPTGYKEFHVGSVLTAEGTYLSVGTLTAGTSHAEHGLTASETMAFYSDTGYGAAIVRAGEDQHGIWVAGSLTPGATPEQIAILRRAPLSGDWRDKGHGLDLVAALAVNRPAFPVLRASAYLHDDKPLSLVAAGIVTETDAFDNWPDNPQQTIPGIGQFAAQMTAALAQLRETITALGQQMAAVRTTGVAQRRTTPGDDDHVRVLAQATQRINRARTDHLAARMNAHRQAMGAGTRIGSDPREKDLDSTDDAEGEPHATDDWILEVADHPDLQPTPEDVAYCEQFASQLDGPDDAQAFANWVEKSKVGGGHLPEMIRSLSKKLTRKGMTKGHAIAVAVNAVTRMCLTGDLNWKGRQNVNPKSRARACANRTQWEAMKAEARAKRAAK